MISTTRSFPAPERLPPPPPARLELGLGEALSLYLKIEEDGELDRLRAQLRDYLYEHLSIAEMEEAERGRAGQAPRPGKEER
jgi:hypothetical protein